MYNGTYSAWLFLFGFFLQRFHTCGFPRDFEHDFGVVHVYMHVCVRGFSVHDLIPQWAKHLQQWPRGRVRVCEWAHARMCHRACTRWSPSPIASLLKLTESTLSSFKDREMRFFPVWIILEKWASGMNCPNKLACFSILFYCLFWLNLLFFIFLPRKLQVLRQAKPFWKSAMAFK